LRHKFRTICRLCRFLCKRRPIIGRPQTAETDYRGSLVCLRSVALNLMSVGRPVRPLARCLTRPTALPSLQGNSASRFWLKVQISGLSRSFCISFLQKKTFSPRQTQWGKNMFAGGYWGITRSDPKNNAAVTGEARAKKVPTRGWHVFVLRSR